MTRPPSPRRRPAFPSALLAAVAVAVAVAAGPVAAADPGQVVILLHPTVKDAKRWAERYFSDSRNADNFDAIRTYDPKKKARPFATPGFRVEVANSVRDLKDWRFAVQYGPLKKVGAATDFRNVPYSIHYRETEADAPQELGKGVVRPLGDDLEQAVYFLGKHAFGHVTSDFQDVLAPKIMVGKPVMTHIKWYPAALGAANKTTTGEFTVHNRLPVPVELSFDLQSKFDLQDGDLSYTFPSNASGSDDPPFVLGAGEERSVTVGLKEYRGGNKLWVYLRRVRLLDAAAAPGKK